MTPPPTPPQIARPGPPPTGGAPGRDPTPKEGGGTPPPSTDPKLSHGTMCFVGAGDFVLGIRQGEFFLFDPMCLYSKYSKFCGEFKNGQRAQCSHLAHLWATFDFVLRFEAEGLPEAAGVM